MCTLKQSRWPIRKLKVECYTIDAMMKQNSEELEHAWEQVTSGTKPGGDPSFRDTVASDFPCSED